MKLLIVTAALAVSSLAAPAFAQGNALLDPQTYIHGSYVEVQGGATFQGATSQFSSNFGGPGTAEDSGHFRNGYFVSGLVGHRLVPGVALEAEGVYFNNRFNRETVIAQGVGGESRTYGGFGNLRFSVPYDYRFSRFALTPYIAGGIGYGDIRTRLTNLDTDQGGFMWQGKAGIEIKTGSPVSFDLGYRYIEAPEVNGNFLNGGASSFSQRTHVQAATFGVKYTF